MFNFLKKISGAIIIGISIIIGLNFQEFKDFSETSLNSIIYVVSGQKAEDERLRKESIEKAKIYEEKQKQLRKERIANNYKKVVTKILSKKDNLLSNQEINNLIKIKIPKECLTTSEKIVEIKNTSKQIINHVTISSVIRGKVDKKNYKVDMKKYDFKHGLLPEENIKISCYKATDLSLYSHIPNDKLIIDRGYNLVVNPLKVNSFYNSEIKTAKLKQYLNCSQYYKLIRANNFTKNKEVENLCYQ